VVLHADSGLGDVGKHVVGQALKLGDVTVCAISESMHDKLESAESVTQPLVGAQPDDKLVKLPVDIEAVSENEQLSAEFTSSFADADAVVCCIGNRQHRMRRVAAVGTENVISAMKSQNVKRLVAISSTGVADGWPPLPGTMIGRLFALMLSTTLRGAYADLKGAQQKILSSGLDYLIVCPAGVTPTREPAGSWKILDRTNPQDRIHFEIAKEDVAKLMLKEALEPTHHETVITVGEKPQ